MSYIDLCPFVRGKLFLSEWQGQNIFKLSMSSLLIKEYSVQSLSHARLFVIPWIAAHQASLSITNSRSYSLDKG